MSIVKCAENSTPKADNQGSSVPPARHPKPCTIVRRRKQYGWRIDRHIYF